MFIILHAYFLRITRFAVWIGGAMMLLAAFMVSVDVIGRKFFGLTVGGADEISGYLFAVATAFAFPYAALHRANVRIDVIYMHLPARLRGFLDLIALGLLLAFALLVTWRSLVTVGITWANQSHSITPLHTPLILPQGAWVLGWIMFSLTLVFLFVGLLGAFLSNRLELVQMLGGALSMEEEIEEETQGVLETLDTHPGASSAVTTGD